jgi:hypothetical protein
MDRNILPSDDDNEDILLSCRYGELDDVRSFIAKFGTKPLSEVRDDNGSSILHMVAGNGHVGELLSELLACYNCILISKDGYI